MTRSEDSPESMLDVSFSTPAPSFDVSNKERLFKQLGQAHMVPILHEFESNPGPRRFSELQEKLEIPQTTLTSRLQELTELGFVSRTSYDEIPPRVEYTATKMTTDLAPAFEYLCRWAAYYEY
jgi:DNA-binding HxlR family transcriptional regulator